MAPSTRSIWESSRLALDEHGDTLAGEHAVASLTYATFSSFV